MTLLSAPIVQAQVFNFGPRAGFTFSQLQLDDTKVAGLPIEEFESDFKTGVSAGIFFQFKFAGLLLQPEAMFSQESGNLKFKDASLDDIRKVKFTKLDVPVLVGFKLGNTVRLLAGPVMTYTTGVNMEPGAVDLVESVVKDFDSKTWGYQVGAGLDLGRLAVDLRYGGPFAKRSFLVDVGGKTHEVDYKKQTLEVTLGINLVKS